MKPTPTIPQADEQLIERLTDLRDYLASGGSSYNSPAIDQAIARLRTLTTRPIEGGISNLLERLRTVANDPESVATETIKMRAEEAINMIRTLTAQPPSLPSNAEEWVPLSERKPTKEDGVAAPDSELEILFYSSVVGPCVSRWYEIAPDVIAWRRLPAPPAPAVLTPEKKDKAEDEKAYLAFEDSRGGTEDEMRRITFLAGRQSLRTAGGAK